jgi:hypothetical protein
MLKNFLRPLVTDFRNKLECLLLESNLSLGYCLWAKPGVHPRLEQLKGASLGKDPANLANTILSWKGLQGMNTLAHYKNS